MRRLRQIALLGAGLGLLGGAVPLTAAAQDGAATAAVEQKLQHEAATLARSRFEQVGGGTIAAARKDEPTVVPIELKQGATYAVVAVCGGGCDHVEIALFDPAQKLLHRSPERSDVVIVAGPARRSGVHGIALSIPGCRSAECPAGFVVLEQMPQAPAGAPASPPVAHATPAPPSPAPPPSGPTATPGAGSDGAAHAVAELARLAVTARDAARARERTSAPVSAPVVTDARTAPGRPAAAQEPAPKRSAQHSPGTGGAAQARCQQVAQDYAAYARTAGAPGTMPQLFSMYQYLQCNCGYPPSPQLPPCAR
jgi:hypothetical protein